MNLIFTPPKVDSGFRIWELNNSWSGFNFEWLNIYFDFMSKKYLLLQQLSELQQIFLYLHSASLVLIFLMLLFVIYYEKLLREAILSFTLVF